MNRSVFRVKSGDGGMIFVEGFRLLFVLAGSLAGFEIGRRFDGNHHSGVVGLLFGAGISYVVGGVAGRIVDRGLQRVLFLFRNTPPGEIFAASLISSTAMLLGLVIGLPLAVLLRSAVALIITSFIVWVLATLGWRLGSVKGRQIVAAAGLSRILSPPSAPPQGQALLIDSSAVMDRFLLVLGKSGLLPSGLILPQFVVDHVRSVAATTDPVTSRRARRGLESIEALREMSVPVHLAPDEVPEVDDPTVKILTVARRLGLRVATCSSAVVDAAARWELPCVDLRAVAHSLTPDHVPGEQLEIDLVKEGSQPRQAVGYLDEGDMVVVNDAIHLLDQGRVRVTVLSTRPTSQGVIVFARLATDNEDTSREPTDENAGRLSGRARRGMAVG
jgi:uncharacterized protein YacL